MRFDTRFYVTLAPAHSPPRPDGAETTEAAWIAPRRGARAPRGRASCELVFPTIKHLESLLAVLERRGGARGGARPGRSSRSLPRVVGEGERAPGGAARRARATDDCPVTGAASTRRAFAHDRHPAAGGPRGASSASSPASTRPIDARQQPIVWPVTPYYADGAPTIDITTGLGYPKKANDARRNPQVALLFSDPTGSGINSGIQVLVQGTAEVDDRDLDGQPRALLARVVGEAPGHAGACIPPQARCAGCSAGTTRGSTSTCARSGSSCGPTATSRKAPECHEAHLEEVRSGHSEEPLEPLEPPTGGGVAWDGRHRGARPPLPRRPCSAGWPRTASRSPSACRSAPTPSTQEARLRQPSRRACRWRRAAPA